MRISDDLVVQNVGGEKLVLAQDSTGIEVIWPIGSLKANQAFAAMLDDCARACIGHFEMPADSDDDPDATILMSDVDLVRFAFAAGYLVGASR